MTDGTLEDALDTAAEYIQTEAKKTFSLTDKLNGIRTRRSKVLLFTDIESLDRYTVGKGELSRLEQRLGLLNSATNVTEAGAAEKKDLAKQIKALKPKVEELFADALKSSLGVHLRGVPNVVFKVAKREARQRFALNDGTIPALKIEEYNEFVNVVLLQSAIEKITTPEGEELILLTEEQVQELADTLPPTSWDALTNALDALITKDTIADAATDDPGF